MAGSESKTTAEWIAWARGFAPEPMALVRLEYELARQAYDGVDARLGDDAEGDEFLTKVMWLEITIRLAKLGWTVEEFEDARWPVSNTMGILSSFV